MPDNTPKPHYFEFTLKGYAIENNSRRWGYFRTIFRDRWDVFDKEGGRAPIILNYRHFGDDYRTLFGFEYQVENGILNCGLEQVILTADHSSQGVQTSIVDTPHRKKYELVFLSEVCDKILQNSALITECSPVKKERHYTEFHLEGFPEEFLEAFQRAIHERQAYSLAHLKVFIEMEKLGLRQSLGNTGNWGIVPEAAGRGYGRRRRGTHGQ